LELNFATAGPPEIGFIVRLSVTTTDVPADPSTAVELTVFKFVSIMKTVSVMSEVEPEAKPELWPRKVGISVVANQLVSATLG